MRAEMLSNPQQNHRGEPVTCAGNTGGRRDELAEDSALRLLLVDGGGGDRRNGMAGVVSGLWGSALRTVFFIGSTMTNQITPKKSLKIVPMSLANFPRI